jgi:hypothetical protein
MTVVGCQPLRAVTHYRTEEHFIYYTDGNATSSLIGVYSINIQTKMSPCVMEKTKIYYILLEPSCSPYRIPIISKAYQKQNSWVLS